MLADILTGLQELASIAAIAGLIVGLCLGVVTGALPGLSGAMTIALVLPLTFTFDPLVGLAMMAGIYNGASFGGAIPAILLNIPGTPAAIATGFDGYPMSQQGQSLRALKLAAISSAIGGTLSALVLILFAPPLAEVALAFGPPEVFWVAIFGLVSVSVVMGSDPLKGLIGAFCGLILGSVGIDQVTGAERLTFGIPELYSGVPLVIVLMGLFAVPAVFRLAESPESRETENIPLGATDTAPHRLRLRTLLPVYVRSSATGIFFGLLPGLGGAISALVAYGNQKKADSGSDTYGKGNPLGVIAAETGNSSDNSAAMVLTLTLGIPGSGAAAVILVGLMVHGLDPGPRLFQDNPGVVFGFMWAMLISSVGLLIFANKLVLSAFLQTLRIPIPILVPAVLVVTVVGSYASGATMFNTWLMVIFGIVGYFAYRLDIPPAPVLIAMFLGPSIEFNLRISLLLGGGNPDILISRPISLALISLTIAVLVGPFLYRQFGRKSK